MISEFSSHGGASGVRRHVRFLNRPCQRAATHAIYGGRANHALSHRLRRETPAKSSLRADLSFVLDAMQPEGLPKLVVAFRRHLLTCVQYSNIQAVHVLGQ